MNPFPDIPEHTEKTTTDPWVTYTRFDFASTAGKQVANTCKLVATHYSETDEIQPGFGDMYRALLEIDPGSKDSTASLALQLGSHDGLPTVRLPGVLRRPIRPNPLRCLF